MAENRIDPTVPALFLVALITLVFGFLGIDSYQNMGWKLGLVAAPLAAAIGIVFVVFTISAIRVGNAFAAALFGFVAIALYAVQYGLPVKSMMMFIILALIFIVFVIVAFMVGAPKLLAIMLLCVALLYLFVGLFVDAGKADSVYGLLFGIFGILAGLLSLYLAFALSTQKLPVF